MDVANSSALTAKMSQADHERIMGDYHAVAKRVDTYGGRTWKLEGDCVISVFGQPERAVMAMVALLHELNEFNTALLLATTPFLVRIGIAINREGSLLDIPEDARTKASRKSPERSRTSGESLPRGANRHFGGGLQEHRYLSGPFPADPQGKSLRSGKAAPRAPGGASSWPAPAQTTKGTSCGVLPWVGSRTA